VIASLVGVLAYHQMDDRRCEPLLPDLLGALRRGTRRPGAGTLIAVEGATAAESAEQARRLADWLRAQGHRVSQPGRSIHSALGPLVGATFSSTRARALAEAAVRADVVEREVWPALRAGETVVMDRFLAMPLVQFDSPNELDSHELDSLTSWATGRLLPDLTVLLDRAPALGPPLSGPRQALAMGEEHVRMQRWLTRLAAAEPHRYVVVDADATPDVIAERIREGVQPLLRRTGGVGDRPVREQTRAR
jgi:dTMP kinase